MFVYESFSNNFLYINSCVVMTGKRVSDGSMGDRIPRQERAPHYSSSSVDASILRACRTQPTARGRGVTPRRCALKLPTYFLSYSLGSSPLKGCEGNCGPGGK